MLCFHVLCFSTFQLDFVFHFSAWLCFPLCRFDQLGKRRRMSNIWTADLPVAVITLYPLDHGDPPKIKIMFKKFDWQFGGVIFHHNSYSINLSFFTPKSQSNSKKLQYYHCIASAYHIKKKLEQPNIFTIINYCMELSRLVLWHHWLVQDPKQRKTI